MLKPTSTYKAFGVKVNVKLIPDSAKANKTVASWVLKGGKMKPCRSMVPIGITCHNTADLPHVEDDGEQYTRATWPNCNMGGVVVHYYVDDLCAWQNLKDTEQGWHAADGDGPGNTRTIAVEVIMDGSGSAEDLKARDNAARLIAYLLDKYNFTIDDLYTHNHWMGQADKIVYGAKKNCPIYLLPKWGDFKNLVEKYIQMYGKKSEQITLDEAVEGIEVNDKVKIKAGAIYSGTNTKVPTKYLNKVYTVTRVLSSNGVVKALIKELNSWVEVKYLNEVGVISVGDTVQIKSGAVYGGLSTLRGKVVAKSVIGKTYTVDKIQTNKGVTEARLKEILSWVAVRSLNEV